MLELAASIAIGLFVFKVADLALGALVGFIGKKIPKRF